MFVLKALILARIALSIYVPESGDDWTLLRPDGANPVGSFDTLPFEFGVVVNSYTIDDHGTVHEPPISSVARSSTTTVTTSVVTPAPKPTNSGDVAIQITDGQVQRSPNQAGAIRRRQLEFGLKRVQNDDEDEKEEVDFDHEAVSAENSHLADDSNWTAHESDGFVSPVYAVACMTNATLRMTLEDSVLLDSNNRIGSIVSSHQFQFDGPVPQYGAIFAAGWSVTDKGQLALGNSTKFYQCASGDFYNLYDTAIHLNCHPVILDVVELIEC